eukprot:TRINITY_DN1093_c0_g2_i1.p2 TRINITY_DN1093_c0_g2~~TRINITY_DN1093_c0_g2_i1.p2  ORF type:complete len:130 (-),score=36.01 TRINITY_DN1093_c0_g2_i1:157-546(-)
MAMKQMVIALLLLVPAVLVSSNDGELEQGADGEEQRKQYSTKATVQAHHDMFWKEMDKDQDGYVTHTEVRQYYVREYHEHTKLEELLDQAKDFFDEMDRDKDGRISEAEHYNEYAELHAPHMDPEEDEL